MVPGPDFEEKKPIKTEVAMIEANNYNLVEITEVNHTRVYTKVDKLKTKEEEY